MKKYLKVLVLIILLTIQVKPVFADDTTLQSSTGSLSQSTGTGQTAQSSTSASSNQSTTIESSTQTASQTNTSASQTTPASTTTQQPVQKVAPAPALQNTPQSSSPASSSTIINETVNNNNSKNSTNIWLIILSSLSALVTIIGGLIAMIRHFRNRLTQKTKLVSVKNNGLEPLSQTKAVDKTGLGNTQGAAGYQSLRHLTETQQMNQLADHVLKENKNKTSFRRSRR